ncbi:MAG: winged helix-turn-helix domain-containing protein [Planctomycetota bacterium]
MRKTNNNAKNDPCPSKRDAAQSKPPVRDACEKYELAITNYVLGEQMNISDDELFNHLRQCKKCREHLYDWQNTYAAMRTKEYFSRPETKKKMADMIENVKKEVLSATSIPTNKKKLVDVKWEIGSAAGKIYNILKESGELPIPALVAKTGLKEYHVQQAVGWLAGQEKILLHRDDKTAYVSLNPGR